MNTWPEAAVLVALVWVASAASVVTHDFSLLGVALVVVGLVLSVLDGEGSI